MLLTFKGGIHPPENKHITEELEFVDLAPPGICFVPLQQHIGAPSNPVVNIGDTVVQGQLIAGASGFVSANVHAPVSGRVTEIVAVPTVYQTQMCIAIEYDSEMDGHVIPDSNPDTDSMSAADIINAIRDAGIVGLGGAAFPTAVKLSPPPEKKIDVLVINGAECEPYLTVDDVLMRTYPNELIKGIQLTLKALGLNRAVIGIEDNKSGAVAAMRSALSEVNPDVTIEVIPLKTKYPQGAEKQLIFSTLRRVVPSRGLPMDVGVIVQNIGTIYSIYEALYRGKPLYERFVTVSGAMIKRPGNYRIKIGTPLSDVAEQCGGLKGDPAKIVIGGPMCGISVHTMEMPVVQGTSGILFLSEDEVSLEDFSPCIRCGKCVRKCPVGLVPCDIGNAVENGKIEQTENLNPYDCIMCGSCTYVCPSNRPLSHFIKIAQQRLKKR